jgi:hypothetical protein
MTTQLELKMHAPEPPDADEVAWLVQYLYENTGFHTARQIADRVAHNERKIRQLAEHADGAIVSGPGSPGYCHTAHCPPEVLSRVVRSLESQAKRMLGRARRIQAAGHRAVAGASRLTPPHSVTPRNVT